MLTNIVIQELKDRVRLRLGGINPSAFIDATRLGAHVDPAFVKTVKPFAICEVPFASAGNRAFDGACRVDLIARVSEGCAAAFELKLGTTRWSSARIEEWMAPCVPSHGDQRWKGNVMAVLSRRFAGEKVSELTVRLGDDCLSLLPTWYVIAPENH